MLVIRCRTVAAIAVAFAAFAWPPVAPLGAQSRPASRSGIALTPYAGYLVTGNWFDGPLGTNISATNAPLVGAAASVPLARSLAVTASVAYASGDLRVGIPLLGGIDVGTARTFLYDAGLELGGLAGRTTGIAPFIAGGVGGMTNDIKNGLLNTRSTNLAYSAGVGLDVGIARGFALRAQAKDWIGRFDSQEAIGVRAEGNLAHNWALTAGVRLAF